MLIDCDACVARGPVCGSCVVTVLLGAPPANLSDDDGETSPGIDLDSDEQAALAVLAGSGLVPPLRLIAAAPPWPTTASSRPGPADAAEQSQRESPGEEHPTAV